MLGVNDRLTTGPREKETGPREKETGPREIDIGPRETGAEKCVGPLA